MGSEEGIISFLDTSRQSLVKNEFQAHQNAIFDIAWVPGTENKVSKFGNKVKRKYQS